MSCGSNELRMSTPDLQTRQAQFLSPDGDATRALRLALVTSEPLFREGIAAAFGETSSLLLLDGTSLAEAVALAQSRSAEMVVVDASGLRDLLEMASVLASRCPQLPIAAVVEWASADDVAAMLEAGIRGCILKGVEGDEFVRILVSIGQGALYLPPEFGAGLLRQSMRLIGATHLPRRRYGLTSREEQILGCVARALTNKEVARELHISEKTVKHYMTVIMEKLQVRNRVEAVQKANARQWIMAG